MDAIIRWSGIIAMGLFCILVLWQLVRYFCTALEIVPRVHQLNWQQHRYRPVQWKNVIAETFVAFLLSRILVIASAAIFSVYDGSIQSFLTQFSQRWRQWDAHHYIGLIENWYVTQGDARLHLVFFPLYPLICRGLYLLGMPAYPAALLVSNLSFFGAGVALYELVRMEYGMKHARRALWLMMFSPVTFFFSMPYTESVFLLMTLLAVLTARKKHYVAAVFFGAMAANARTVGLAVAIPIFWEMLHDAWTSYATQHPGASRTDLAFWSKISQCVLRVLPVALGFVAYLLLNVQLHGNAFQFLIYQRENWSQEMGSLANTIHYTMQNAMQYSRNDYQMGVWIPQIITIFTTILLFIGMYCRQHPGDMAYALVYFYLSVSPTWLLSGTRYVAAMYALYPMLAVWPRGKNRFGIVLTLEIIACVYMSIMCLVNGHVL